MLNEIKTVLQEEEEEERPDGGTVSGPTESSVSTSPETPAAQSESDAAAPSVEVAADSHLEMDQVFGILKNKRRRYVLKYLSMVDGETTLSDLAEQIAAWECEKDIAQITSQERKRVYVGLYQCHLPKMADVSAIDYNKQRGDIEAGEHFNIFSHYLPPGEQPTEEGEDTSTVVDYVSTLLG